MHIDIINTIEQFEKLKKNWDDVYSADPNTTIFTSWAWLRGWIESTSYDWSIITVKPNSISPCIAFMPIGIHSIRKFKFYYIRMLFMGGYPWSDHEGFVCLPEYVDKAIPAFANYIQKNIKWDTFIMQNVFDPRLDLFLKYISPKKFEVLELDSTSCPYVLLPDNWNQYLQKSISSTTRKNLKYYTKKIESFNEFRVIHAQADNLDNQIETLLTFYQTRWGPKSKDILNSYITLFRRCFENNILWLTTIMDGTTPIAGLAAFLDHKMKIFTNYTPVFNNKFEKQSPGKVMIGYSIRYAIENGFRIYDFGAGNEEYKFSFGTAERFNKNVNIIRKTFKMKLKNRVPRKFKNLLKSLIRRS